jgi:hypothetical protein
VQYASTPGDDSMAFPRFGARVGVSDRVDVGGWGGVNRNSNWGLVGADAKIALLTQASGRPVSVSIRPSVTSLVAPSDVWVGNASLDLSVSRTFGAWSPYVGGATSASLALERSNELDLDPVVADGSVGYTGLAYHWRVLVVAAEVEKGKTVSYGLRVGTRF